MEEADPAAPPVLTYSRTQSRRWPRVVINLAILLAIAVTVFYSYPRVSNYFARRAGLRKVQAWYQRARTASLPPTTLLYSEDPADFPAGKWPSRPGAGSVPHISLSVDYPHLRTVGYLGSGVPVVYDSSILFAGERLAWDPAAPTDSSLSLVALRYAGLDPAGLPAFQYMLIRPITQIPIRFHAGMVTVPSVPARPLTHLRLYAGQADSADPAVFTIPFRCDAGAGDFFFRLDTDPAGPHPTTAAVDIRWGSPATTYPAPE